MYKPYTIKEIIVNNEQSKWGIYPQTMYSGGIPFVRYNENPKEVLDSAIEAQAWCDTFNRALGYD